MRTSCVKHPENEPLLVIRAWQVRACEGNHCAAALLSFFEYWHNIKLAHQGQAVHKNKIAELHGEPGHQDVTLLQFHNAKELEEGLLGLYDERSIRKAIKLLEDKGFITLHKNPNPRYALDRTRHILFSPEMCSQVIDFFDSVKIPHASGKNTGPSGKNTGPSGKNTGLLRSLSEISFREEENSLTTFESFPGAVNDVHPPGSQNGVAEVALPPPKTTKATKPPPISPDDWPGLRELLLEFAFPLDHLDDNDWWNDLSYTCNGPSTDWLTREFAKMHAWLSENKRRRPTTGWKKFVRGWLERAYEQDRRHAYATKIPRH